MLLLVYVSTPVWVRYSQSVQSSPWLKLRVTFADINFKTQRWLDLYSTLIHNFQLKHRFSVLIEEIIHQYAWKLQCITSYNCANPITGLT